MTRDERVAALKLKWEPDPFHDYADVNFLIDELEKEIECSGKLIKRLERIGSISANNTNGKVEYEGDAYGWIQKKVIEAIEEYDQESEK